MINSVLSYTGTARNPMLSRSLSINGNRNVGNTNSKALLGLTDYKYLPSKIKPPMSDEEFKQKMIEQAQKDAALGIYGGSEFKSIEESYIRVGSPNRTGIITGLFGKLFPCQMPPGLPNALVTVTHKTGSPMAGFSIASYSQQQGWLAVITPTESSRLAEINGVYREAWKQARDGDIGEGIVPGDGKYTSLVDYRSIYSTNA